MNFEEYKVQLAPFVGNNGAEQSEVVAPIWAPYDNFYNNDLLLLLYHSKDELPGELDELKQQLQIVAGGTASKRDQANAAIEIGRYVRQSASFSRRYQRVSQAAQWFELAATEYESVVGVAELAKEMLAAEKIRVDMNFDNDLLPLLVGLDGGGDPSKLTISPRVSKVWKNGIRLAVRFSVDGFQDWEKDSVLAAISCIVNFLTFAPKTNRSSTVIKSHAASVDLGSWVEPTWSLLIEALQGQSRGIKDALTEFKAQQQAVLMMLRYRESSDTQPECKRGADTHPLSTDNDSVVVIKGKIPASTDRDDTLQLTKYEVLRKPLRLVSLPGLEALHGIRKKLQDEFPWAKEAITVTMSEMFARKMHGSKRLGMQPVLLAGLPGTGKTRFAQRLSELLGTPSAVINMGGMTDVKVLKGVTRGWSTNRPSRIVEVMLQNLTANPLFILDEVDKAHGYENRNGGNPQDALLDLLEPGNARRYSDIYLMTECDLSHALYVLTANSLQTLSGPLKSRLRMVNFPAPGPEHAPVIVRGILHDMETSWNVPAGTLHLEPAEMAMLVGLSPREMRRAVLEFFGHSGDSPRNRLH